MKQNDTPKHRILRGLLKIILWTFVLTGVTVGVSIAYKGLIELGIFQLIPDADLHLLVFCVFELLLLGMYWHYILIFSRRCRHRCHSLASYYLRMCIVYAAFCTVYLAVFKLLGRDAFLWVFRVTVNLIGFKLITYAPDNLAPYMIIYLLVTFLIIMLEPVISMIIHKIQRIKKQRKKEIIYGE